MLYLDLKYQKVLTYHDLPHDIVTTSIQLASGRAVLGRPLQVDNVEFRPMFLGPIHAPQPGITT